MREKESWGSLYRKKKFYERQKLKKEKEDLEKYGEDVFSREYRRSLFEVSLFKKTNQIAVMLDLEGTSEKINEETAEVFVKQLEFIREKFEAEEATISLSTHYPDSSKMQNVLTILSRHTTNTVKIGLNFFFGGIYEFDEKKEDLQEPGFNSNKVSTFETFYIRDFEIENTWFAIIDDEISEDIYKEYQNEHPMLLLRPSQIDDSLNGNFMCYETKTKDFDGVIEGLNAYIETIKNLSPKQILQAQRNMVSHLSAWEVKNKVINGEFSFLERYFSEGYADEDDYRIFLHEIGFKTIEQVEKTELVYLKNILHLFHSKFVSENNEPKLEVVKRVENCWNCNNDTN